jgi:hypothetical protein
MEDDKVMIIFTWLPKGSGAKRICQFESKHFDKWLKLLNYAKQHEIDFWPREDDENIDKDILDAVSGIGMTVEDVCVNFGSGACIQNIEAFMR